MGKFFKVNGDTLGKQYKDYLSGFYRWDQLKHAEEWVLYPDNLSETVCIDEVALSDGELYTVVTNGKAKGKKGALIAMVGLPQKSTAFIRDSMCIGLNRVQRLVWG